MSDRRQQLGQRGRPSFQLKDCWLREYQLWELFVKNGSGILACSRDTDDVAFREVIESTDFPFGYVHLYV